MARFSNSNQRGGGNIRATNVPSSSFQLWIAAAILLLTYEQIRSFFELNSLRHAFSCDELINIPTESKSSSSKSTMESSMVQDNPPPVCSHDDLLKIRHQLPPAPCIHNANQPYFQKCSFTVATKCPKATWLDHFYEDIQQRHATADSSSSTSFLGISVGCNKGFDAINTLRMGTFDASIDKREWRSAMEQDGEQLHSSVCNQNDPNDLFRVDDVLGGKPRPNGEMHCIEPMAQTYQKLHQSAKVTEYEQKGLKVTHAAVSKQSGELLFYTGGGSLAGGIENKGLENPCQQMSAADQAKFCESVPVYSLKQYIDKYVQANIENQPINILSIDVEGFDGDVLLGASSQVLQRVEYLEFEYNWMGSWKNQHLWDIITMLDETAHMTCYWAGIDRLWRVTNCWMQYFDLHMWSNVVCANRKLVPTLAFQMEETFRRTLLETDKQWFNGNNLEEAYNDHELMSTNPETLAKKYYRPSR